MSARAEGAGASEGISLFISARRVRVWPTLSPWVYRGQHVARVAAHKAMSMSHYRHKESVKSRCKPDIVVWTCPQAAQTRGRDRGSPPNAQPEPSVRRMHRSFRCSLECGRDRMNGLCRPQPSQQDSAEGGGVAVSVGSAMRWPFPRLLRLAVDTVESPRSSASTRMRGMNIQ